MIYSYEEIDGLFEKEKIEIIIANGEPKIREKLFNKVRKENLNLGKLIDPSAVISPSSKIKDGTIITPLCSIQANAEINENVLVNTGSIIGHDILVGKNSVVSSFVNIGGSSIIGEKVFLGMGCMIKENLKIGSSTIIGMGSFVHRSVGGQLIVMGNPARPIKKNEKEKIFRK